MGWGMGCYCVCVSWIEVGVLLGEIIRMGRLGGCGEGRIGIVWVFVRFVYLIVMWMSLDVVFNV